MAPVPARRGYYIPSGTKCGDKMTTLSHELHIRR